MPTTYPTLYHERGGNDASPTAANDASPAAGNSLSPSINNNNDSAGLVTALPAIASTKRSSCEDLKTITTTNASDQGLDRYVADRLVRKTKSSPVMSPVSIPAGSLMIDAEQRLPAPNDRLPISKQQQIMVPKALSRPNSLFSNNGTPEDSASLNCNNFCEERRQNSGSPYPSPSMQNRIIDLVHGKRTKSRRPPIMIDTLDNTVDSSEFLTRQNIQLSRSQQRRDSVSGVQEGLYGSLVGSYEESILTGRLSTPPSKPISFVCQIGVISMEGRKSASAKCPPHIVIPFKASFYEWTASSSPLSAHRASLGSAPTSAFNSLPRMKSDTSAVDPFETYRRNSSSVAMFSEDDMDVDTEPISDHVHIDPAIENHSPASLVSPPIISSSTDLLGTPYVGTVDLEWGLGSVNNHGYSLDYRIFESTDPEITVSLPGNRSSSDPLGALRIPLRGQLQILVKNQNRTAVKVFLVPYDYRDMKPFSRTFLRQKSFSAPSSKSSSGKDIDAHAIPSETNASLRYALHLQFLCLPPLPPSTPTDPTKNSRKLGKRLYLYKSIRVVFSHRVPDGSERLTVIYETPEGRFECPPHLAPRPCAVNNTGDIISTETGFK